MGVVLWDVARLVDMAWLINVAALVTGPAGVFKVAELVTVSAKVEGLTGLGVVAALAIPSACVHLDAGAISPGVVKDGTPNVHFFGSGNISRRVLKDNLWGEVVVGVGAEEGIGAVMAALLELKELLSLICDAMGGAADAGVEGPVTDDFCMEGVVALKGDGVINQPRKGLVRVECKLLFAGHGSTGIGVCMSMEGMGVDVVIASTSEEQLGGLRIKVKLVEGGGNFSLVARDGVREEGGVVGFIMVDEPSDSWMEAWQGLW